NVPRRLILMAMSKWPSGCGVPSLARSRVAMPMPAQLTATRSGADSAASSTACVTCSSLVTSAATNLAPPPSSLASASPRSARRSLTIGLVLTVTAVAFEALAVATVLPVTVRELGDLRLYGWVFSAFMLADLVGLTLWGRLAVRRGPARSYSAGVALFAAGLVI